MTDFRRRESVWLPVWFLYIRFAAKTVAITLFKSVLKAGPQASRHVLALLVCLATVNVASAQDINPWFEFRDRCLQPFEEGAEPDIAKLIRIERADQPVGHSQFMPISASYVLNYIDVPGGDDRVCNVFLQIADREATEMEDVALWINAKVEAGFFSNAGQGIFVSTNEHPKQLRIDILHSELGTAYQVIEYYQTTVEGS